jgi:hypothetical protein
MTLQEPWQRPREDMNALVKLEASKVEHVSFAGETLVIDARIPVAGFHGGGRPNHVNARHGGLLGKHGLQCLTGRVHVARELVLQHLQFLRQRNVEISRQPCSIIPGRLVRGRSDDMRGAQQRYGKQAAERVVGILNDVKRMTMVQLPEFAIHPRAQVQPIARRRQAVTRQPVHPLPVGPEHDPVDPDTGVIEICFAFR